MCVLGMIVVMMIMMRGKVLITNHLLFSFGQLSMAVGYYEVKMR